MRKQIDVILEGLNSNRVNESVLSLDKIAKSEMIYFKMKSDKALSDVTGESRYMRQKGKKTWVMQGKRLDSTYDRTTFANTYTDEELAERLDKMSGKIDILKVV